MRRRIGLAWRRLRAWYGYGSRPTLFCYCGRTWPRDWTAHGHVPGACAPGGCSPEACAYARVTGHVRTPGLPHWGVSCVACGAGWRWSARGDWINQDPLCDECRLFRAADYVLGDPVFREVPA